LRRPLLISLGAYLPSCALIDGDRKTFSLDARLARCHVWEGMKHDPFDFSGGGAQATGHAPSPVPRLKPGEYGAEFLENLKTRDVLFEAPPQWDGNRAALPPTTEWVLHTNGELERIGFS
jgi:hypothetical protein